MPEESKLYQRFGRSLAPGDVIFSEGETGDQMFIIHEGRVKVSKNIGGREHVLSTLGKGDFFGEMAIVNNVKRTATITALTNVELLAFNREGFLSMINKNAKIALNVIDKLCRRLQNMNSQIQQLVKRDLRGLIALNLHYAFQGAEGQGGILYLDRIAQEIAFNLQVPMDQVRETLEEMGRQGILTIKSNQVTLSNPQALSEVAGI